MKSLNELELTLLGRAVKAAWIFIVSAGGAIRLGPLHDGAVAGIEEDGSRC